MEELKELLVNIGWMMAILGSIFGWYCMLGRKYFAETVDKIDRLRLDYEAETRAAQALFSRCDGANERAQVESARLTEAFDKLGARVGRLEEREWSNKQIAELQAEVEVLKARTAARVDGADDAVFGAWVDRATFDEFVTRVQRLEEREATITVGLMKTCDFAHGDEEEEEEEDDLDTIEDGDEDGEA